MFRRRRGYRRVETTLYEAHVSGASHESDTEIRGRYASEISSSLPLQILIYYNALLSAMYLFLEGSLIVNKAGTLTIHSYKFDSPLQRKGVGLIFATWALTEVLRIYMGYKGNIKEMVPHMCSFLLMTIFPQMFFIIYLGFLQEHCFPFDSAIGWIHIIFMVCELVLGYNGTKAIINKRTSQFFRLAQEELLTRPERRDDHPRAS